MKRCSPIALNASLSHYSAAANRHYSTRNPHFPPQGRGEAALSAEWHLPRADIQGWLLSEVTDVSRGHKCSCGQGGLGAARLIYSPAPHLGRGLRYFSARHTSQWLSEAKMLLKIYEENDGLLNT